MLIARAHRHHHTTLRLYSVNCTACVTPLRGFDPKSQVSSLKSQISSLKSQVSNLKSQIANRKSHSAIPGKGCGFFLYFCRFETKIPTMKPHRTMIAKEYIQKLNLIPHLSADGEIQVVIEPEQWFAAALSGNKGFSLVGCAVVPAFSFGNFELAKKEELLHAYPQHKAMIERMCR